MPLPSEALTLTGGCNCRAVRYRITVPALADRPPHPMDPASGITFPIVPTDHCNDCRRATGAILPMWMCVPAEMLEVRLRAPVDSSGARSTYGPPTANFTSGVVTKETYGTHAAPREEDVKEAWAAAMEAVKPTLESEGTTLRFFESSDKRTRTFCGQCGTNLFYTIWPMVQGLPDIFDVVLGTMDEEWLRKGDMLAPDRHCWMSCGVPWIMEMHTKGTVAGAKLPQHPTFRPNETFEM